VAAGDRADLTLSWSGLASNTRYLGAVSHETPFGVYDLTIVDVTAP
jgi:hypothetical protein